MYCKFILAGGNTVVLPYDDIFHVRRFFNDNELLGDDNQAIDSTLDLAHSQEEGLEQGIKASATIRGILNYNTVVSPEKLKQEKDIFMKDYLSMSNNGGIVATDSKSEYIPIEQKATNIDSGQIDSVKNKIYQYLGVSENIVNSNYTEEEFSAFYESTISPLALQFSQEFTQKIFTKREQAYGNAIIFEGNRLKFASNKTKTAMIEKLLPMGLLSVNEAREIFNIPSIEEGDRFLQSLNYVDTDIVNNYQMTKKGGEKIDDEE